MKRLLVAFVLMSALFVASAGVAFGHTGHTSCRAIGERVSSTAQAFEPNLGAFVAPFAQDEGFGIEVAAEHGNFCDPR